MNNTSCPIVAVVEDEEVVGMFIREALLEVGFGVELYSDATSALTVVDDFVVRAALVDVGLPGMSGDELVRLLHSRRPSLPIVLMTGYEEAQYQHMFEGDSNLRVVGKPFDIPRLFLIFDDLGIRAPLNEELGESSARIFESVRATQPQSNAHE